MSAAVTIRMKTNGFACWHTVAVAPLKQPLLKRLVAGEPVDVSQLGTVLCSGWGEPPTGSGMADA